MLQTDAEKAQIYDAIFAYSFNFIEPDLSGTCLMIWKLIEPVLKKGNTNYINGSKPKKKAKRKRNRSEIEANNKPNVSEVEAYKDKDKDKENDKDKNTDITLSNKSAKLKMHSFEQSPYSDYQTFEAAFMNTKTFRDNPTIVISLLYDALNLAEPAKYKYTDWIRAAQNWYKMHPERYLPSVKAAISQTPFGSDMSAIERQRAADKLKTMQRIMMEEAQEHNQNQ